MRGEGREYVMADSALKRMQVDTRAFWLDADEHHPGLALGTGGALKSIQWNGGRRALRLGHDASPQTGGSTTLSVTGNPTRNGEMSKYVPQGSQTRVNFRRAPGGDRIAISAVS